MLDAWPISRRVGLGFLMLTAMIVGLAAFSHRSVGQLGQGYTEYRDRARQFYAVAAGQEDIIEARLAALKYRTTADPVDRDQVTSNINEVFDNTDLTSGFADEPARQAELERLFGLADEYQTGFQSMADELGEATVLQEANQAQAIAIKEAANLIFERAVQNGNPPLVAAAGRTLQTALSAVVQSKQVALSGTIEDIDRFNSLFADFEGTLSPLRSLTATGPLAQQVTALQTASTGYGDTINQFAQITTSVTQWQENVLDRLGPEIESGFDALGDDLLARQHELGPMGASIVSRLQTVIPTVGILSAIMAVLASVLVARWISRSVEQLADTTDRLAAGDLDVTITGSEHKHELGRMARALTVFRTAQIERTEASAERAKLRMEQDAVVKTMQSELAELAKGNLTTQIAQEFAPEYEQLRINFNQTVAALQETLSKVATTTAHIGGTTAATQAATSELSQRTENQAATLEQTAAALDQLTASIRSAAEHAKSVDTSVKKARSEATKNGEIVAQAVSAMDEIEESSKQITQVIGVIDDIAFQTNLLALNAGVEAARAGDSGKGFAVVASEVRALAQRSAEAAKEISELIANSTHHVQQGTQLVGNAGEALSEVITQVDAIALMTTEIATSAEEQSIGLSEINIGVNQLDQATQQNAAMVQESMSRGDALVQETGKLHDLVGQFQMSGGTRASAPQSAQMATLEDAIANTHQAETSPPPSPPRPTAKGNTAEAMWENF